MGAGTLITLDSWARLPTTLISAVFSSYRNAQTQAECHTKTHILSRRAWSGQGDKEVRQLPAHGTPCPAMSPLTETHVSGQTWFLRDAQLLKCLSPAPQVKASAWCTNHTHSAHGGGGGSAQWLSICPTIAPTPAAPLTRLCPPRHLISLSLGLLVRNGITWGTCLWSGQGHSRLLGSGSHPADRTESEARAQNQFPGGTVTPPNGSDMAIRAQTGLPT